MSGDRVLLRRSVSASHHDDEALAVAAWHDALTFAFVEIEDAPPPLVKWQYPWGFVASGEAAGWVPMRQDNR